MSGIMRCIKIVRIDQDGASDEASRPLGIEAEVEVDIWRLRYAIASRPDWT